MKSCFVLAGILVASVHSFAVPPQSPVREATRALYSAVADAHETTFWGEARSEEEITDFVSNRVFDRDGMDASVAQQEQWVDVISAEPPLLIVHGFLEDSHCEAIIDATMGPSSGSSDDKHQLKRSTMGAEQDESDHRTSSTAWLREERCPLPLRTFASRASALSGLPCSNMENLQVVRYEPGEEFKTHTDHLDSFNDFDCGGRLCTCLVYLNDSEETIQSSEIGREDANGGDRMAFTGGETNFQEFGAAIPPKKGSAVFFWNTLERPGSKHYDKDMFLNVDSRLRHAGLPVLSGEKFVANRWMHPRAFGANVRGL